MKYQTYPAYKDSGVEWLGDVPEHWFPTRLKFESFINMGQSPNSEDCNQDGYGMPFLQGNAEFGFRSPTPKQYCDIPRKIANEGELLFSVRAPVGALNIADQKYGIGRGLCAIASKESVDSYFLWWLIPVVKSELNAVSTGSTFEAVSAEQVENVVFFRPTFSEQQKIAQFLDHETAKIDTLIEKQQRLIELLKEKRQAVISHAVTKGLNPNAPMKDSGVEWLGEVPEGWEVGCLKRFADIIDCKHFTVKFIDDGLPIVSIREVRDDKIDLSNANLTSENEWHFLREGRIPKLGDLIFCRNASVGAVGYVDFDTPFCMGQDVCLIRPEIASRYIHYQLTSVLIRNQIEAFLIGATIRRANVEEIRNLFVIYPPEDEQHLITDFLNRKTAKMDALILKAQNAIELMQERRTALISAAVTGKIDVRSWGNL